MRRSLIALSLVLSITCSAPKRVQVRRDVALYAATSIGEAVPGLRAWADGVALGETDQAGALTTRLRSPAGRAVKVTWSCPPGYEGGDHRSVVLDGADASARAADAGALTPLMLKALCEPRERFAALVVRIRGAPPSGLPIRVRDEVVGRTDIDGLAHVLLRVRPMGTLSVGIDTSEHPSLVPQSPLETFQLGADESILLLDRELTVQKPSATRGRAKAREHSSSAKPYRIR